MQQYITDLLEGMENKFLVFCFHLTMIQAVRQILIKRKVKHICITGEVNSLQRGVNVDLFQTDPHCRVAVLSIQAAATVSNISKKCIWEQISERSPDQYIIRK